MATSEKRLRKSYELYLKMRADRSQRGYGLDRELTFDEFSYAHAGFVHGGEKHPTRKIVTNEVTLRRNEAAAVIRRLKNADQYDDVDLEALKALQKKYKKASDLYSQELTAEEAATNEQKRRERLRERGKEAKNPIQATARARIFNELRDAGLSYKEADEVLYG